MININNLYNNFMYGANVPQQGYISPIKFNQIVNLASYSLFKQRLGYPEQMEMQTAIPRISYHRTSKIHTDLTPFRKKVEVKIKIWKQGLLNLKISNK